SQVRQYREALRLRLRCACPGGAAVVAGLCAGHRADPGEQNGTAYVPARAVYGTGIVAVQPVDGLVLSGVSGIVLTGVSLSCYQACQIRCRPGVARASASLNFSNLKALTFCKGLPFRWTRVRQHVLARSRERRGRP